MTNKKLHKEPAKILIVDDDNDVLEALKSELEEKGFVVKTVSEALKALEIIYDEKFDIVISDIRMPDMSGIEFLAKVKEILPKSQQLMLTAYADEDAINVANLNNIYRFTKPWNEQLTYVIHEMTVKHDLHKMIDKLLVENEKLKREIESLKLIAEKSN